MWRRFSDLILRQKDAPLTEDEQRGVIYRTLFLIQNGNLDYLKQCYVQETLVSAIFEEMKFLGAVPRHKETALWRFLEDNRFWLEMVAHVRFSEGPSS